MTKSKMLGNDEIDAPGRSVGLEKGLSAVLFPLLP